MAREHTPHEPNGMDAPPASNGIDASAESNGIDITCPKCESGWTCDEPHSTCPDCGTAFSVRVREEFALVERGGWTVAVSISTPDGRGVVGDG